MEERRLECRVESVPEGRAFTGRVLAEVGLVSGETTVSERDDILLIVTELLANAVRAGTGYVTLRLAAHRSWLEVAVTDDSPVPARRLEPSGEEIHGRGVGIVAALSAEWGQSDWDGRHKTVWSRVRLPAHAALAVACDML